MAQIGVHPSRPFSVRAVALAVVLGVVPALTLALPIGGTVATSRAEESGSGENRVPATRSERSFPLVFDSELILMRVADDSLEVEGIYHLRCPSNVPGSTTITLFYPFPVDSLQGEARVLLAELREGEGPWRPMDHKQLERPPGTRWPIPISPDCRVDVRIIYRQERRANLMRYIVTTTSAWGRPLREARFEITLPPGATPTRFSFPFEKIDGEDGPMYVYEATQFLPDRDIVVEWTD